MLESSVTSQAAQNLQPAGTEALSPEQAASSGPNRILWRMFERLLATLVNGPSLNCRPHSSRQRVDLFALARLKDAPPESALLHLLGDERQVKFTARVPAPPKRLLALDDPEERAKLADDERAAIAAWKEQESFFNKIRAIAEDARNYEQDTGVHVLHIGFPLLSLPPNRFGGRAGGSNSGGGGAGLSRRILAPIAFMPVSIVVKQGTAKSVELRCTGEGTDRVVPNVALLAWLEQQTGKPAHELFSDEQGEDAWREVRELVSHVAVATEINASAFVPMLDPRTDAEPAPDSASANDATTEQGAVPDLEATPLKLKAAPRTEESDDAPAILPCAILGLFPQANQGLLRDMQAMLSGEALRGPVEQFVKLSPSLLDEAPRAAAAPPAGAMAVEPRERNFAEERMITEADPCQSRAVRLAKTCPALVVHGPPGTGKSQTITNIVGDHLARGERVLIVSDKRSALDVVANRLRHLGLGGLVGLVHDPQRDQRDLYKALRQQLDDLPEAPTHPHATRQLEDADEELQKLHAEVTKYAAALNHRDERGYSFHDLVGEWFGIASPADPLSVDERALSDTLLQTLDHHTREIQDVLERALAVDLPGNPWRSCAGIELSAFMARPMAEFRAAMAQCVTDAEAADAAADPAAPPFAAELPLETQAEARRHLAPALEKMLRTADAGVRTHWAGRSPGAIRPARQKMDEAASAIGIFKGGPLDPQLRRALKEMPARHQTATQCKALQEYVQGYRQAAVRIAAVRAAAPNAGLVAITRWLARDAQALPLGQHLINVMRAPSNAIAAAPLDRELARRFAANPVSVAQLSTWLAALEQYQRIAGKWYALFKPGIKSAARGIAYYFGIPLDTENAKRMHEFLTAMRTRLNLKADLEENFLAEPMLAVPADDELLRAYAEQAAVAAAIESNQATEDQIAAVPPEAVHSLIQSRVDAAAPIAVVWRMPLTLENAERLARFVGGLNARHQLVDLHHAALAETPPGARQDWLDDHALERSLTSHAAVFDFVLKAGDDANLKGLDDVLAAALRDADKGKALVQALDLSPTRAMAIMKLVESLGDSKLFSETWLEAIEAKLRGGEQVHDGVTVLAEQLGDLESILRINIELATLPKALKEATSALVKQSASVKEGLEVLRKAVLGAEIVRRLAAEPQLQGVDGQRLRTSFDRYRMLDQQKKEYVRRAIVDRWVTVQKTRLMAGNGTRLNAAGADLKRRLTLRGERAMRLRQVVQIGAQAPQGDPLFDLCPVWMASPETVAQVFPRQPLFDVVIFDEASQCRLEEALPVLTRGKRVVIAGDLKQLPPTKFFESAVAHSDEEEIETDQQLFESQQGEIEDLLGAALNLEIQECYLDVHYRSRNSELIEFSNANFYGSRLQAIPGHPSRRTQCAPLTLYRADGVYEKRKNLAEAERVVSIVRDLLQRPEPPSIGIACFSLTQRDLIVEKLDELAEQDADFARRLEAARKREGAGTFEGLFVKNLENVQGDERDHLIISTTYGPDPAGRFYRRFGPVGSAGGGRRLNVLVTRARAEVHLVTSIPSQAYRSLPPIPAGQTPTGAYLLFAYLRYAEQLAETYEHVHAPVEPLPSAAPAHPLVRVRPTRTPSRFAQSLANRLATDHGIGSDVHWGNDGFCVDLALRDPARPDEVTLGVLCDTTRFTQAADRVEWDIFRTGILESQGWTLHRLWTPHFYRDTDGGVRAIIEGAQELTATESNSDEAPVVYREGD
jgi:hypothetical protein